MIKTRDYAIFKLRHDNRTLELAHIEKLVQSIQARNLLEFRPIIVNSKMEILDGQHRLEAAKKLGVEIYYQIQDDVKAEDIITLNISKAWNMGDYLNYYVKNDYEEYKKLKEFMTKHNLKLIVCMAVAIGSTKDAFNDFKTGKFVFQQDVLDTELEICWDTINCIRKYNGRCQYAYASRFWKALLKIVKHPDFNEEKWRFNMVRLVDDFAPKARCEDYVRLFQSIYNNRNHSKIKFIEEDI